MLKVPGKRAGKDTVIDQGGHPTPEDLLQALQANPNLVRIVQAWPHLSAPVKSAMLTLLETAK
jgi:hypothetical protein